MAQKVVVNWENTFKGTLSVPNGKIALGSELGELAPYNLLFGALASCFYATFLDIVNKKRLPLTSAKMEVNGEHRDEVPYTLKTVVIDMDIVAENAEANKDKYLRSVELAQKYCSIYTTVSQVAQISVNVKFINQ